jgi:hypothetical protein
VSTKHRLPVVHEAPAEDANPERRPWQWVGFGTVAIFVVWLPLAALAQALSLRVVEARLGTLESLDAARDALPHVPAADRELIAAALFGFPSAALALAALAGGFLVGRWGGRAGPREAALAGVASVLAVSMLAWMSSGLSWAPLAALFVAGPVAAGGGWIGYKGRPRASGSA